MFDDRRKRTDRRMRRDPAAIPATGCRRQGERRSRARRYQVHPWWLMTGYAEELEPPVLQTGDDDEQRTVDAQLSVWLAAMRRNRGGAPA